jgi:hypothetical protein
LTDSVWFWFPRKPSEEVEDGVIDAVNDFESDSLISDQGEEFEFPSKDASPVRGPLTAEQKWARAALGRDKPKLRALVKHAVIAERGYLDDNPANRLLIKRTTLDKLNLLVETANLRLCDVSKNLDTCVEFYFLPTDDQLERQEMIKTREYVRRKRLVRKGVWTWRCLDWAFLGTDRGGGSGVP